jgi:large subunit ribosomal protein L21
MYAVIEANGRQFLVREGEVIRLDRIAGDADAKIVFDRVILAHDGKALLLGSPLLNKASVTARVLRQAKDRKIMVFHYKPKKRIRKRHGHRQPITELRIEKISL